MATSGIMMANRKEGAMQHFQEDKTTREHFRLYQLLLKIMFYTAGGFLITLLLLAIILL